MEPLPDPLKDRVIKEVYPPPYLELNKELFFDSNKLPNYKNIRDHLLKEGKISKKHFMYIINTIISINKSEPNIIKVHDPVTVVGDIHGQYYDLVTLLNFKGLPINHSYIFLGDYVDRGSFSTECIILLYILKIIYKKRVILLRGNHECRQLTSYFNFRLECEVKYDIQIYDAIMASFDSLPIGCIVNDKFLCIHGGLSPKLDQVNKLDNLNRFSEIPKSGLVCDLMWADPIENDKEAVSTSFKENKTRNCSYFFGLKAAKPFLQANKLLSVFRAHEAQLEGFKMYNWDKQDKFPQVITIFSAPNYCDMYNNKGSIVMLESNNINVQQFNYSPHPYILPDFQNIFNWSIPFISEKISEMLYHTIKVDWNSIKFEDEKEKDELYTDNIIKMSILTTLMKMLSTLREEKELILKLKGCCPGNKIPRGLILQGAEALKSAYEKYNKAKVYDIINEKRPDDTES